ncbi:bifunctional GNAT family N-acetyltransferase/ATP-binding protein [Streptomyces sp. H27-C3]|uniref:ATP-binding protein n=1 Tax=Streptomyces sp. H27-C3 TaxID=3046305 RepID=UPI0024BBCCA0|nr:bifunctional GNAT family N-acetyltransferase/ATP-binding protein [Streptomyces sp. H27-C3]MDJ0465294.1 bifunctional GNAT family N-acetyltransferase/ATP-binding protein [Streptomyces sp. H27-C3]
MNWLIHDYRESDLAAVVHLIDTTAGLGQESVFSLAECIGALTSRQPAVVAVHQGVPIGAALACVAGERGWVMRIAIASAWRGRGLASALLVELERRLVAARVGRIAYVLPEEDLFGEGLLNAGYTRRPAVAYFEKVEPLHGPAASLLDDLGGRFLPSDLWAKVAGMEAEKDLIERRIVLPLAEPERATRHGVRPPRAVALFGPPGTGKTTFARGIASKLGWPFVELLPSRLADEGNLAAALRSAFARIAELERVLVFIDEVEEIAPVRTEPAQPGGMHGVTNELLKLIPGFRERDERLLVCATNSIRSLDPAFLRPGRFDYLIPIGTPDTAARNAIWSRYTDGRSDVDVAVLVAASELFTPADIEHAARSAAQAAFERDLETVGAATAGQRLPGAGTEDYLAAIAQCRPTVTPAMIDQFGADITAHARF